MSEVEQSKQYEVNAYHFRTSSNSGYLNMDLFDEWSMDELHDLIRDPMSNNEALRRLSEIVYNSNGIVTNTIDYMVALPTFDRVVVPYGDIDTADVRREQVKNALDSIRDVELGRDCLHNVFVDGVAFYYLETSKRPLSKTKQMSDWEVYSITDINSDYKASCISLSPDYTKIVGIKNSSYVLAFNLEYFDLHGTESAESKLRKYPKEIREAYRKYHEGKTGKNWYVLDNDRTIAVKFRAKKSEPWGRPLVLAALEDIFYADYFTDTKRTVLDEVNNRIYYQTFPEGDKKGMSALTQKQQEAQHNAVKQGITSKNNRGGTSFFSVAAGTKIDTLETNVDLLDEKNETNLRSNVSTSIGFAGSLLSGAGNSSYSAQESNLRLVTAEIFHVIELFTNELNKVLNADLFKNGKNCAKVCYLPITFANRSAFADEAKSLYLQGRGSLLIWAAAVGIRPEAFTSIMDYEVKMDFENKYPVHQTSFTQSASDSTGGRPSVDDATNPNTVASKTNNTNSQPKPGD